MRRILLVVLAVVASGGLAHAQDRLADSPYYPLKVGTRWDYLVAGGRITARVARHEKIGGELCALIETVVNDAVVAREHVSAKPDGIYRHSFGGMQLKPPVRFIKLPPKVGERWDVESKMGKETMQGIFVTGRETVKVQAGEFEAISSTGEDFQIGPETLSAIYWFAEGVGMVKQSMKAGDTNLEIELERFHPAE